MDCSITSVSLGLQRDFNHASMQQYVKQINGSYIYYFPNITMTRPGKHQFVAECRNYLGNATVETFVIADISFGDCTKSSPLANWSSLEIQIISVDKDEAITVGEPITFNISSQESLEFYTFIWYIDNSTVRNITQSIFTNTFNEAKDYRIRVATNTCSVFTISRVISVEETCEEPFIRIGKILLLSFLVSFELSFTWSNVRPSFSYGIHQ